MGSPNHRIGSIILSLLLPVHLDAQLASPPPPAPGLPAAVILGTVSDEHTRSPVSGVLVTAGDNRSDRLTAVTDTGGKFEIPVPRPGMYSLETERIGYRSSSPRSVNVGVGDTAEVHVVLSPTPMLLDSLLVVGTAQVRGVRATEQLIHGKLLDFATRAPIPDATIQLLGPDGSAATAVLTNPLGLFRIVAPMPGTYRLRAERIGYRAAQGPAMHLMLGDTLRIEFALSEEAVVLDPLLVTASARAVSDRYPMPGMEDFFRRMSLWGRAGYFANRMQLQEYARFGYTVSRVISEMALNRPRGCNGESAVYWDGAFLGTWESMSRQQGIRPDDAFPPAILEAIELYIAPQIPADLAGGVRFPCRVIVFWSVRQPRR